MTTSIRMQMVPKSEWLVTNSVTLERRGPNKDYRQAVYDKENELYKAEAAAKGLQYLTTGHEARTKAAKKHANSLGIPETYVINTVDLVAGEVIKITGKSTTSHWTSSPYTEHTGLYFPVEVTNPSGKIRKGWIPFQGLEGNIQIQKAITVHVFAIRDTNTGKLFKEITYGAGQKYGVEWTDTYTKSKRWPDIGKFKMWVMGKTGYYEGMPGAEDRPYWSDSEKELTIESSWEIVEFDKLAKAEVATHDVYNWFTRLWELRELTIQFGSPVRKLYNDLDKKGVLDNFKGMLVARLPVREHTSDYTGQVTQYYDYDDELDPADVAAVDEAIKQAGFKKSDIRRAKSKQCVAVAFSNTAQAMMIKLAYTGKLRLNAINLETLKETVSE